MSESEVKKVYDTLSGVETKLKEANAYPIHKRLDFGELPYTDVYDWIAANIQLPNSGKILDAGCGVGYGSFYLCERSECTSLGISLSEREIAHARQFAIKKGMEDRCRFEVQSFDSKLNEKFDLIVAVESVKHSMNLDKTLRNLLSALQPSGKLIVVEDLFLKHSSDQYTKKLLKDWYLQKAYTLADYTSILDQYGQLTYTIHDLTQFVIHKHPLRLSVEYFISNVIGNLFRYLKKENIFKIFRGGYALESLYNHQQVRYQIIELTHL